MPYEKHDKARVELTEEQRRKVEETGENDIEFDGEELEERIAPGSAYPVLDEGVL